MNIYQEIYNKLINNNFNFSLNQIQNAFLSPQKIYADKKLNLIKQTSYLFNLSDNFINKILQLPNAQMLTKDILLSQFDETSQQYQKIINVKQDYPIFIYKINFSVKQISSVIQDFCLSQNKKMTRQIATQFVLQNLNLAGAVISLPKNVKILLFNKRLFTKQTIIHEFYHYFQDITKFGFTNKINSQIDKVLANSKTKNIIKKLGFSICDFKYIFSKQEFLPHINDLTHILNIVYNKYYLNKMTSFEFLNLFINSFVYGKDLKQANKFIDQYSTQSNDECSPLYMVKLAYLLNFKYDIILEKLNNAFSTI